MNMIKRARQNTLGVTASLCFFFGSTLFLPVFGDYATVGVWLFMAGSALMFADLLGPKSAGK
ncbi:MAG: hypothetical protein GYB58_00455 [Gammaproteobacteria bacterium]|nr:hypothetical protein [Gammaproteobacteria bacterium]